MATDIRVLFLADTHIGFDLPVRPRVERRRRGHDFLANYQTALGPAMRGEVDVVVHGGDFFDRSRPVTSVGYQALEPLRRVAERGVPVFIVPGNHERSRIPHERFALHPNVRVFDRPRAFTIDVRGHRVTFAGFPYERDNVRERFPELLRETGWDEHTAASRVLCMHHCVEGATVGPANFTFTTASDVIRLRDIPSALCAVLSGHIHRHQVLTTNLAAAQISPPVLYPGSVERTSLAEIDEVKGFMIVTLGDRGPSWEFRRLPARPMIRHDLDPESMDAGALDARLAAIIAAAPRDAVVVVRINGRLTTEQSRLLSSSRIRALAPHTMNVEINESRRRTNSATVTRSGRRSRSAPPLRPSPIETSFSFLREEIEPTARAR
jgi:DNA repair protein SbcD/Mre11